MKTYKGWGEAKINLTKYLDVGDAVDEAMYDYFLCVLPPAHYSKTMVQIGEPFRHINNAPTFLTLVKNQVGWMYAGICFEGKTDNMVEDPYY